MVNWSSIPTMAKWAIAMMLVAILPTVAGISIGKIVFGEAVPPFVYIFPVIWLALFFVSLRTLRIGLIGGIVWAAINIPVPIILMLQDINSSIGKAVGMPVCPFSVLGSIISAAIIYLCISAYKLARVKVQ